MEASGDGQMRRRHTYMRTYTYRRTDIQREWRSRIVIEWLELSPLVKIEFRRRWGWMWGRWGAGGLWTLCEESWYGGRGRGAAVILTATRSVWRCILCPFHSSSGVALWLMHSVSDRFDQQLIIYWMIILITWFAFVNRTTRADVTLINKSKSRM